MHILKRKGDGCQSMGLRLQQLAPISSLRSQHWTSRRDCLRLRCVQVKELRTQNERLEDLFEDGCAKRQAADSRLAQLRRAAEADKATHAKQVCHFCWKAWRAVTQASSSMQGCHRQPWWLCCEEPAAPPQLLLASHPACWAVWCWPVRSGQHLRPHADACPPIPMAMVLSPNHLGPGHHRGQPSPTPGPGAPHTLRLFLAG